MDWGRRHRWGAHGHLQICNGYGRRILEVSSEAAGDDPQDHHALDIIRPPALVPEDP